MKILFVSSGNKGISPIVRSQGKSLQENGVSLDYYLIEGRGVFGYICNVAKLTRKLTASVPDVIHAHYSLCGFVASLASIYSRIPVIVSLMGSDVKSKNFWFWITRVFSRYVWDCTIVKSEDMYQSLGVSNVEVIPNGVDLNLFHSDSRVDCRNRLKWNTDIIYILFGADPSIDVKNISLALQSYNALIANNRHLTHENCQMVTLGSIPHNKIADYLNASNVLLLTSKWEGSPNIIKEAMACGIPIVSTDVGDVRMLINGLTSCYVADQSSADIAQKLMESIRFQGRTDGRDRLIQIGLDSISISNKVMNIYQKMLSYKR